MLTQAQEPYFTEHEIDQTYLDIRINVMFQDNNCMIWLGTDAGLMQYNGFEIIPVPHPDTSLHISVTAMYQDKRNVLWIGTEDGNIFTYVYGQGIVPQVIEEGWPREKITGFAETNDSLFWIATYGEGLYCHDGHHLYNYSVDDSLLGDDLYCIVADSHDRVWVGTDRGLSICEFSDYRKKVRNVTKEDGLPDHIVKAILADQFGNMWIGTHSAGFCYYDLELDSIYHYVHRDEVGSIQDFTLFDQLELWVGTETNGLWRYDLKRRTIEKLQGVEELDEARISDVLKDIEGNLWITSNVNTIHTAYRKFELLPVQVGDIQALFAGRTGHLWIGTPDGLFQLTPEAGNEFYRKPQQLRADLNVTSIIEDAHDNLWIGTLDAGVYIYRQRDGAWRHLHEANSKLNNTVMDMARSQDKIWIATLGGVFAFDLSIDILDNDLAHFSLLPQMSSSFIYDVYVDHKSRVWFGTDGEGAMVWDGNRIRTVDGGEQYDIKTVYSITGDSRGHMWLNTADDGLFEYDGERFIPLSIKEGLISLDNTSLTTDLKGDILITHPGGIDVMKPAERHFMYFDDEVGIRKLDPGLNATASDHLGYIWIGAKNLVIRYHPLHEQLSIHPRTQIINVNAGQDRIDYYNVNHFPPDSRYFLFDYIGLWYTSPGSVKYLYKLDGYDPDWKESKDHLASYSNLGPGDYTFHVKASENKFFHDEPITSYPFTIAKPLWQRVWFIILIALALTALIYQLIKIREKRSKRDALMKKEKIESQFLALKAQINPHFLFNSFNTLVNMIDEDPDNAVEYVEKLSDFYRNILQYREHETIYLDEEIELVQSYYYLLQQRFGDSLQLSVDVNDGRMSIPPLTLQMLVENAVKHNIISKSRPLSVLISTDRPGYVSVKNNMQEKLSKVSSTRFGLQSIINRYQLLSDKKVIIEKTDASFNVSVPLIKQE